MQRVEHFPNLLVQYLILITLLSQHSLRTVVDLGQDLFERQSLKLLTVRYHHIYAHLHDCAPADAKEVVPQLEQALVNDFILSVLLQSLREDSNEPG